MNYSELQIAVQTFLDHSDADTVIPLFVELARAKINRKIRNMEMVCVAHAAGDGEKTDFDLPEDWAGARQVSVNGKDLDYLTPEMFTNSLLPGRTLGTINYTIRAKKIRFSCAPSEPDATVYPLGNIELAYYRKVPKLIKIGDTNWLLEDHPDIWIYAAVAEGHRHTMDEERANLRQNLAYAMIEELRVSDWNDRWSAGTLRGRKS